MKSTILASLLCAVALSVDASSLGQHSHHKSLLSFRSRHTSHKRHAAALTSSSQKMIKKRKTPGSGDSTTQPANLAKGSYTAKQGCAVWHTVGEGEVCLGLIDKSSAGFDLTKFLKLNPSLNDACSNLATGKAYCVDTVASVKAAAAAPAAKADDKKTELTPAKSLLAGSDKPQADAQEAADDEEDCEEEDESVAADDDEDCEEEEDDSADTVITVKTQSKKVAAPAQQNAPAREIQAPAPKVEAPKPTSTYVAPTPTYVAPSPTSTYVAPSPEPKPEEPKPEEPKPETPSNGGGFAYSNQPATYYMQNGNPGSCGDYNNDDAYIVAVKSGIMGSQLCGKSVKLRNTVTGKEIVAKIADTCPTCANQGIDLSRGLFQALAPGGNLGLGVLNVDYSIL